mmetsp:Transcript_6949/g.16868  ORF Transcript_6949/g.16868 Transcript_6949/m.16868 type:complete len:93 (+) Transcript_6949:602-880(+)
MFLYSSTAAVVAWQGRPPGTLGGRDARLRGRRHGWRWGERHGLRICRLRTFDASQALSGGGEGVSWSRHLKGAAVRKNAHTADNDIDKLAPL